MRARRLPPGQQLAAPGKWPIVGEHDPGAIPFEWSICVSGCVASPRSWSLKELRSRPQVTRAIDIHCVTRWTIFDATFTGVPLAWLLDDAKPTTAAQFVSFIAHSPRDHSTSLPLADVRQLDALAAFEYDGQPLSAEHGGPVRLITPGRYFYKSVKWLRGIELLAEDRLGFWEGSAGYHNHADPWLEQRFVATGISKHEAAQILASRDVAGRDLLGLDGSDRELIGLRACDAKLATPTSAARGFKTPTSPARTYPARVSTMPIFARPFSRGLIWKEPASSVPTCAGRICAGRLCLGPRSSKSPQSRSRRPHASTQPHCSTRRHATI